jgi:DNA-binding transcriptional ArsR family regulator
MNEENELANLAGQLADPARASIVLNLMDGSSRPTGELQIAANISPSSASGHLSKLVDARILSVIKQGRLKYYRISTAAVAHAIEALTIVAFPGNAIRQAARSSINPFSFARTCYDHLAGKLGVQIIVAMQTQEIIRPSGKAYEVTDNGLKWLQGLGIDCNALRLERRLFAPQCLDFTERRPHLGGALGAALFSRMEELKWLVKLCVPRAVRLTSQGRAELGKRLGVQFSSDSRILTRAKH